jgi:hypothetical protein
MTGMALGYLVNQLRFLFPTFFGFSLFQKVLTGFCPLKRSLIRAGVGQAAKHCKEMFWRSQTAACLFAMILFSMSWAE